MNRHDVLVANGRRGACLAGEPLPGRAAGGKLRRQHLDRHRSVQCGIKGLEDDPHSALPQHLNHAIGAQLSQVVGGLGRVEEGEDLFRRRRYASGHRLFRVDLDP